MSNNNQAQATSEPSAYVDDKLTRIQQNLLLNEYYQTKGQNPHKFVHELSRLAQQSMGIKLEPAPVCQMAQDGSQIIMGDLTKPYSGPIGNPSQNAGNAGGGSLAK